MSFEKEYMVFEARAPKNTQQHPDLQPQLIAESVKTADGLMATALVAQSTHDLHKSEPDEAALELTAEQLCQALEISFQAVCAADNAVGTTILTRLGLDLNLDIIKTALLHFRISNIRASSELRAALRNFYEVIEKLKIKKTDATTLSRSIAEMKKFNALIKKVESQPKQNQPTNEPEGATA